MAITPFDRVKQIAYYCKEMDSSAWYNSLNTFVIPETVAIQGCKEQLNRLAGTAHKCSVIVFNQVRLRKQMGNDREIISSGPVIVGTSREELNKLSSSLDSEQVQQLSESKADFYLLWDNRVYHIQLDADEKTVLELPFVSIENHHVWDITSSSLKEMVTKSWNESLVIATASSWKQVIPIPV